MDEQILIYAAILVAVIVLTIVGILSRYRKCKSDEVLVVYGKTGDKKSAKLYHGGAAFVWPIIQVPAAAGGRGRCPYPRRRLCRYGAGVCPR